VRNGGDHTDTDVVLRTDRLHLVISPRDTID
jgi:hypothetical protein